MSSEIDDPRVFGDGVVTLTVGMRGMRFYVGQTMIRSVRSASLQHDATTGENVFEVKFVQGRDEEARLAIEQDVRVAMTLPWVRVRA